MKIKNISYKRLFNLGNYNNEEISFNAELDNETPEHAFKIISDKIEDAHKYSQKIDDAKKMLDVLAGKSVNINQPASQDSIPYTEFEINRIQNDISSLMINLETNPQKFVYLHNKISELNNIVITLKKQLEERKILFQDKIKEIQQLKEEYGKIN